MKKEVHFLQPAATEMIAAARYYESKVEGLGHRFLNEIEQVAASICGHPDAGVLVRGKVRRRLLHHFPFVLLYIEDSGTIEIVAVMDTRRKPDYWISRL
ncbi:MAG TPA: type II toxin-antitoxin system RelE/ParE family toxin [Candidatus Hydrogenedentes bacterium]|nr:MAG: Plasmid stabilization system protein [Candidatus Hydrogenedentes bacterium ADurb.Bin179]HOH28638.1 type II toxin-antitoxin system RelE/ParE family toxin [Candidatus Hydrogenedentota bacterium]